MPGVEIRAVDDVFDGVIEVGVVPHIHRVAAAKLQAHADEALGRGALHGAAAGNRARERDEVHARVADDAVRVLMRGVQHLERALGQPGGSEAFGESLRGERRLRGMLQHHHVAGHECRDHAVHRDEERVVPGGNSEDHAQRFAPHEAPEVVLGIGIHVAERLRRDGDHVPRALERAAYLVGRVTRGPAHLPGELFGDLRAALFELAAETREDGGAIGKRTCCATRQTRGARCAVSR